MGEKIEGRLAVNTPPSSFQRRDAQLIPLQWALAETGMQRNFLPALLPQEA